MKLFLVAPIISALFTVSDAQDHKMMRGLGRGGGGRGQGGGGVYYGGDDRGQGGKGGGGDRDGGGRDGGGDRGKVGKKNEQGGRGGGKKGGMFSKIAEGNCYWGNNTSQVLFERIEKECNSTNFSCDEVVTSDLECSRWETMDDDDGSFNLLEGCNEEELTEDEKEEMQIKIEEKKEKWMAMTDDQKDAYQAEKNRIRNANTAKVLGCGCCDGTDSIFELVKDKEGTVAITLGFKMPREGSHGSRGKGKFKPGGTGGGFAGRPQGTASGSETDVQVMLDEGCGDFQLQCYELEGKYDCTNFDARNMKRSRNHNYMLYCGCCPFDRVSGLGA